MQDPSLLRTSSHSRLTKGCPQSGQHLSVASEARSARSTAREHRLTHCGEKSCLRQQCTKSRFALPLKDARTQRSVSDPESKAEACHQYQLLKREYESALRELELYECGGAASTQQAIRYEGEAKAVIVASARIAAAGRTWRVNEFMTRTLCIGNSPSLNSSA